MAMGGPDVSENFFFQLIECLVGQAVLDKLIFDLLHTLVDLVRFLQLFRGHRILQIAEFPFEHLEGSLSRLRFEYNILGGTCRFYELLNFISHFDELVLLQGFLLELILEL